MSSISNPVEWTPYTPMQNTTKLCYHYCSRQSHLPIRDLLNDHVHGFKLEPNYESASYNFCASCNQPSLRAAVKDGLSHILFIIKYTGRNTNHVNRYFIVGYYEIGWVADIDGRCAVRARTMCFVPVEHAYQVTPERWQRINKNGTTQSLKNLRHATQRVSGPILHEILQQLDKHDATDDYLREVSRLKAWHNPFPQIPRGRIFIINVGANASSPLQSPRFDDGRFEFVPISEYDQQGSDALLPYSDLRQFNQPDIPLLDLFSKIHINPEQKAHNDPEFDTLTYGDNIRQKGNLCHLRPGDFLFFLARLVPYDGHRFNHRQALFALIGYLEIAEQIADPHDPLFSSPAFSRNAHVRRWRANPSSFTSFALFKGSVNSRRFRYAVPFDRAFVERVPILKADDSKWQWGRTTNLGVIGSYTRTARMHIDPTTPAGQQRARRFWRHICDLQGWPSLRPASPDHCSPKAPQRPITSPCCPPPFHIERGSV